MSSSLREETAGLDPRRMSLNMRKFLLSSSVLIIFGLYSIHLHSKGEGETAQVIAPNPTGSTSLATSSPTAFPTAQPAGSAPPPPVSTPAQTGRYEPQLRYKNGTYTGSVADAFYGNIQVQAVISGGKITDVIFLQYPNDRSTSVYINSQAMPYLKQEAIAAQSANVAGVSGASATSQAFIESLGSALQQAI